MLNPINGQRRGAYDAPLIDPVTGMRIPLICSNFDAHHVYVPSFCASNLCARTLPHCARSQSTVAPM